MTDDDAASLAHISIRLFQPSPAQQAARGHQKPREPRKPNQWTNSRAESQQTPEKRAEASAAGKTDSASRRQPEKTGSASRRQSAPTLAPSIYICSSNRPSAQDQTSRPRPDEPPTTSRRPSQPSRQRAASQRHKEPRKPRAPTRRSPAPAAPPSDAPPATSAPPVKAAPARAAREGSASRRQHKTSNKSAGKAEQPRKRTSQRAPQRIAHIPNQ